MLDDDCNPFIIDFNCCTAIGTPAKGGTPGWTSWPELASVENDLNALSLVAQFIREECREDTTTTGLVEDEDSKLLANDA
ncbi:hypothetical protein CVT25_002126 [Psilocybe cyanescens]|uniref:Uncharacterized protein n=1 Tax=Psilocybe cyanescens TaxID=93625 RepID=A0A409XC52_PSICY|nr:hypothetical protein CVT25_002126 [Psilocybe cyanescens]